MREQITYINYVILDDEHLAFERRSILINMLVEDADNIAGLKDSHGSVVGGLVCSATMPRTDTR